MATAAGNTHPTGMFSHKIALVFPFSRRTLDGFNCIVILKQNITLH